MLSGFWAFVNICIYERKFWEFVTQLAECGKDLTAHATPGKDTHLLQFESAKIYHHQKNYIMTNEQREASMSATF